MTPRETPAIPTSTRDLGRSLHTVRIDPRGRYVVVEKPAGMLSVPGKGDDKQDCVAARVRFAFPHAAGPLVVHRLDMDTSGLLVLGLDVESQKHLSRQFELRRVDKAYIAVVDGTLATESGVVEVPMRPDVDNRPVQIVDFEQGRSAITRWSVLSLEPDRTRLRLVPETGRTHQLRVHCAHMGHPILGDVLYGPQPVTAAASERLLLHAAELEFADPTDGVRVRVTSPTPF